MRLILSAALALMLCEAVPAWAQAGVVRVEERQFKAGAGRITFSEVPQGARNPVYPPSLYRGGADSPTVRFGGHFRGRRLASAAECPRGASTTGCLVGTPGAPLALDPNAPAVSTLPFSAPSAAQGGQPPALGGSPRWNGPVAIWFDRDVAAVGLQGIGFDAIGGTAITVYDRQGRVLGRTVNRGTLIEFMGLATADLAPRIAGLEFHLVGAEPQGFGVDNIRFGAPQQVDLPGVTPPAPAPPAPPPPPPAPRRPAILP
jgi:hypothetical protein